MRFGCPHCGASYHVKDRSRLEKAGGKVRCYRCHQVFLISEVADAPAATLPRNTQPSRPKRPIGRPNSPSVDQAARATERSSELHADNTPADETGAEPSLKTRNPPAKPPFRRKPATSEPAEQGETPRSAAAAWAWGFVAILLLALIVGQLLWQMRDTLPVHDLLSDVCERLGCEVPELRDPAAFEVIERVFLRDPEHPGVLLLRLRFANGADHEQPYPGIELVLYDAGQAVVGKSRVPPKQYLGTDSFDDLGPGNSTEIELFVADPGEVATGFAIEFF